MYKFLIFIVLFFVTSCGKTIFYHREDYFIIHGALNYTEIQFHSDNTYEEYNYSSSLNYTENYMSNGHFRQSGDTIIVFGNYWNYNDFDSTWFVEDSCREFRRYMQIGKKLYEEVSHGTGLFDSTSVVFKKGRSFKLRRIEKQDSLIWENFGFLRNYEGHCICHGMKEHSKNCKLCVD